EFIRRNTFCRLHLATLCLDDPPSLRICLPEISPQATWICESDMIPVHLVFEGRGNHEFESGKGTSVPDRGPVSVDH
ncbi:MAG: hypothetical protein KDA91_23430, partial [Planctomycetaceae bacterium]|nr:hypothetical protein [Planctomycetaceae bacterium]